MVCSVLLLSLQVAREGPLAGIPASGVVAETFTPSVIAALLEDDQLLNDMRELDHPTMMAAAPAIEIGSLLGHLVRAKVGGWLCSCDADVLKWVALRVVVQQRCASRVAAQAGASMFSALWLTVLL